MNKPLKLILILAVVIAALVALGMLAVNALRQPQKQDFAQLDTQRQVLDSSMNLYNPLVTGYSSDYTNVFSEERPAEESDAVKKDYVDMMERERTVNTERLDRMASSPALRNADVKQAFEPFRRNYQAVIDYYDQETQNLTNVIGSVAGSCTKLNKLNFAADGAASDYIKLADGCLKALNDAKSGSDADTKTLLGDVETIIKERRDKFNDAVGKEGVEESARQMIAVVSLLDFNTDLKTVQSKYESAVQKKYIDLVNKANESNAAFEKALDAAQKGEA